MFDAIHEQINEFIDQNRRQEVNEHRFKKKNLVRVRINGYGVHGYVVRGVTPKFVHFVRDGDIFRMPPNIQIGVNTYVTHVHPYIGNVVEDMRNWHTWVSMTQKF